MFRDSFAVEVLATLAAPPAIGYTPEITAGGSTRIGWTFAVTKW